MSAPDLIDLAKPRIIVIRAGEKVYEYEIPRITKDDWFGYFDGIVSTAERTGKEVKQNIDATSTGLDLVDKLLSAAQQGLPPLAHRLAIVNVLTSAYVPDQDMRGFGEVPLVAVWSAGEQKTMRRHKNLVHVFSEPTADQYRRYRRDDSRSQVVGGSRKGLTIYHGAQRTLAELYDELIVRVEGYSADGAPLTGTRETGHHMDTYHKVAAVARLFTPEEVQIEEDEE